MWQDNFSLNITPTFDTRRHRMLYYVIRILTPDQQQETKVLILNSHKNLMDQVIARLGNNFTIISIQVLGIDWP
jgi:hypothetical protein